ncbi:unnamed protein product [Parnassius mnemosyne]|uniref:Uncharacterized protein n=1 Tax=Parnassius mnemosyne TaxID=213953 RepID=A0AAV1KMQ3_9NEOP
MVKSEAKLSVNCITIARQGSAEVFRSASFSKLRESLRRSSARLLQRLAGRHSMHLPPDVDFADHESMKRARSLSELSKESAGHNNQETSKR